jgi:hypothetical protein
MIGLIKLIIWLVLNLAALGVMLLAASSLGCAVLHKQRFFSPVERFVFTTAMGLGLCAAILFGLSLTGLLYRGVILALTAASALWAIFHLYRLHQWHPLSNIERWKTYLNAVRVTTVLVALVFAGYWVMLLLLSQYPPLNWDSTAYHLVLSREYLVNHRFVVHTGVPVPITPALNHMLFTWALALKGDIVAQMVEHAFLILTGLGLYCWGERTGRLHLGIAAAGLWLAHPLVLWVGEAAYVDICLVAFSSLGVYALRVFWDRCEVRWWMLGMTLLGIAGGVKMPGLFFVALGAGLGVWGLLRSRIDLEHLILGVSAALAIAMPCYVVIYYYTGNPFWPTFSDWSRGIWAERHIAEWNLWISSIGLPKTFINFLLLPYYLAADPARFVADANRPLFLFMAAWPVAWLVAWVDRSVRWWTLWALAFTAFWFMTSQQLRLLLPAVPIAGLALYESVYWLLEKLRCRPSIRKLSWIALTAVVLISGARTSWYELNFKKLPPIGPKGREAFLVSVYPAYQGVRYINEQAEQNDSVYVINASWLNYYFKPRVVDSNGLLQREIWPSFQWPSDKRWMENMEAQGVNWVFVHHVGLPPYWGIPETDPTWRPYWPDYKLVYEDQATWVFRRYEQDAGKVLSRVSRRYAASELRSRSKSPSD